MSERQSICLNMIVKNEARVIERCLRSVRPFITTWVIVDTGSTDGTQDLIGRLLADVPGELHERPWVNFGHNRSEALALARDKADYILLIDADEVLEYEPEFRLPRLTKDLYRTKHFSGKSSTTFFRPQFLRGNMPFRYEGVLHEYVECDLPYESAELSGLGCRGMFDGARNTDPRAKYEADARLLEEALKKEPGNHRYAFYLAQSYRDAGMRKKAIEAYERRAKMGGWEEEVYYSLQQIALLLEVEGESRANVTAAYLRAFEARPTRAEPLTELARLYRQASSYATAHLFAERATRIKKPDDILFLDESVYAWRALDELSIASYYIGDYRASAALAERLLAEGSLPEKQRPRVIENLNFARKKLALLGADDEGSSGRTRSSP